MSDRSNDNSVVQTAKPPTGGSSPADARGPRESARADSDDRGGRHQFGDRLARQLAVLAEAGQDPRHAVQVVEAGMELDDLGREVRAALLGRAIRAMLKVAFSVRRLRLGVDIRRLAAFLAQGKTSDPAQSPSACPPSMGSLINAITTAQLHLVETQRAALPPRLTRPVPSMSRRDRKPLRAPFEEHL